MIQGAAPKIVKATPNENWEQKNPLQVKESLRAGNDHPGCRCVVKERAKRVQASARLEVYEWKEQSQTMQGWSSAPTSCADRPADGKEQRGAPCTFGLKAARYFQFESLDGW